MIHGVEKKYRAEAIICGESYDVNLISGPDENDMCLVDVLFEEGDFVERIGVYKKNVFPLGEMAIARMMNTLN